jgi:DNA-binding NarL/FixJ family response regulator
MTKILIVDDHPLYREGVMSALGGHPLRALVVGAASVDEALKILADDPTVDVALVDYRLGADDGLHGLRRIGTSHPAVARVLLSGYESGDLARAAQQAGAQAFLPKSHSIAQMVAAIQTVLDGGVYWPGRAAASPAAPAPAPVAAARGPLHTLTIRQLEVLQLLGTGKSNADIAADLGITERTAKAHLKGVFDALGVDTRVKAVVRAGQLGWLKPAGS